MFWESVCDNLGTIIGVIGSLLGAVIGWWLNNISRRGKLTAYVVFPIKYKSEKISDAIV